LTTPQRMLAFVELVRELRAAQVEYRRTIDARLRYVVPQLESQVDVECALLVGVLGIDVAEDERAAVAVEGGGL
jgi:hypothetical protein